MNTQITPRIAAEISLDDEANMAARLMIDAIREFAHRATTASIVAYAARQYPRLNPAQAVAKLAQIGSNEMALATYLAGVVQSKSGEFFAENALALAAAVRARHDSNSRAAQLRAEIDNAGRRHAEKIKSLRPVLTASELAEIKGPNLEALKDELADTEAKIASVDEYVSASGLKPLPSFVIVSEPIRVSNNEAV